MKQRVEKCKILYILLLFVFISCNKEIDTTKYDRDTLAYPDSIWSKRTKTSQRIAYTVDGETYHLSLRFDIEDMMPKSFRIPISYSSKNPEKAVVRYNYSVPINDSLAVSYINKGGRLSFRLSDILYE